MQNQPDILGFGAIITRGLKEIKIPQINNRGRQWLIFFNKKLIKYLFNKLIKEFFLIITFITLFKFEFNRHLWIDIWLNIYKLNKLSYLK